jgi:sugar phosphate isomerase/epimerase
MRSVSSWSLHRTLGQYVAPDSAVDGGPCREGSSEPRGLPLLELPAALRRHGYDTVQIVHFHLPSRSPEYLEELRSALSEVNIELDTLLIDDGDLTEPDRADQVEAWLSEWLDVAEALGATRARLMGGQAEPTLEVIQECAGRIARLARAHPEVRITIENWAGVLRDAASVRAMLRETGDDVGLLIDLGNWRGPNKYEELECIAPLAEGCHAKCHFNAAGPDVDDYLRSLQILKDAGYDGALTLIYDGPDDDEWAMLDVEDEMCRRVFGASRTSR